ncbi:MAG: DUF4352 domain-containing protein [Thermoplasmatota archaeon]
MKPWIMLGLAVVVLGVGFLAGCIDEVLDPDLEFEVQEVKTGTVSPPPVSMNVTNGSHYLFVEVRVINQNEDNDITIFPGSFEVDDNDVTTEEGRYLANEDERDIGGSIRIDPGEEKTFWVIFEVDDGIVMKYIRYVGTLDEPVERELPSY